MYFHFVKLPQKSPRSYDSNRQRKVESMFLLIYFIISQNLIYPKQGYWTDASI